MHKRSLLWSHTAPTWGATRETRRCQRLLSCNFNPRTHAGCDTSNFNSASLSRNFNPRTLAGCDSKLAQKPVPICTSTIPLFTKPRQINLLYPPSFPFPRQYADIFWCEPPSKFLCAWGSHQSLYSSRLSTQTQKSGPADISSASRSSLSCACWGWG